MKNKVKKKVVKKEIDINEQNKIISKIAKNLDGQSTIDIWCILTVLLKRTVDLMKEEKGQSFSDNMVDDLSIFLKNEDYMKILMERRSLFK